MWEPAESGRDERAIATVPRTCGRALNSALRSSTGAAGSIAFRIAALHDKAGLYSRQRSVRRKIPHRQVS